MMNDIYINIKGLEIEDLFDADLVSIEDMICKMADMQCDIKGLEERIEYLENYDKDFDPALEYGVSDKDFI